MNEFEDVRDIAAGAADDLVTDERLAHGRTALLEALAKEKPHQRAVRTRVGFGIGAGLVAAAAVTGIVIANLPRPVTGGEAIVTPSPMASPTVAPTAAPTPTPTPVETPTQTPPPKPPATADTVIAAAAVASTGATGSDVPDGMFRKYTLHTREYKRSSGLGPDPKAVWFQYDDEYLYASAAPRQEWVWEGTPAGPIIGEWWGEEASLPTDLDEYLGGAAVGGLDGEWGDLVLSPPDYPNLPRDPQALIDALSASDGTFTHGEDAAWQLLYSVAFNVAPADLRAAMWEAVRLLPGSELISVDGDIAVVLWNKASEPGKRMQLTFDMSTGDVLQVDWWYPHEPELGAPADMADRQLKISSEIVDWAPPAD